jgi:GH25 family lysozyme M1 (1,4-beta-N-acetylmuramidase)
MTIFYPDVSDYQAGISFACCAIAMVKATENDNYTNPDYAPAKVRAADGGAYFCAYHFLHQGNGAGQASYAHGVVGSDVPLMIDVEPVYNFDGTIASAPQISDAVDFVNQYRSLGGKVYLLYLPHWYWAGNLGQASLAPLIDLGMLLVSSDYTTYSDNGPGWAPYGGMTPIIWQYTSTATLNGVSPVDFNAYKNTLPDFQAQATTGAALARTGVPTCDTLVRYPVLGQPAGT